MNLISEIRAGQIIRGDHTFYRGIFIGKNFALYRYVNKGVGYRGNTYPVDGYVLAWTDYSEYGDLPPAFVPLRED